MSDGVEEIGLPPVLEGLEAGAARLRAEPRFRAALADYCRAMSAAPSFDWPIYKLFDQMGRYLVCYGLIHNYFAWMRDAGPTPTLTALQASAGVSARQTAGLVAALKAGKLVETEPAPDDRRVKHLKPSRAMIEEIGRSMRLFVAADDDIAAAGRSRATILARRPDALGDVIRRSAAWVRLNGTLIHPFPRVLSFAQRDCGYLLLTAVFAAHYGAIQPGTPAGLSLSRRRLAERFQISPAHVGNLMGEAERQGWLASDGRGRLLGIDPGLIAEFEQWASWQMVHFSALADAALADVEVGA